MFTDLGANANFGYQSYPAGAAGNLKRREWNELARKLVGKVANKIEHTVFYKADPSYYPWRPDGQRRLLNDGTFGDEGPAARPTTSSTRASTTRARRASTS